MRLFSIKKEWSDHQKKLVMLRNLFVKETDCSGGASVRGSADHVDEWQRVEGIGHFVNT
jgi:hypothetical protein